MDFSENIAIKTKSEILEAHFWGKQYAFHCTIVQPGEVKFVYDLSDDTTHDPSFVQQVQEDIFDRWEIRDETIVVKGDNDLTKTSGHLNLTVHLQKNIMFASYEYMEQQVMGRV